MNDVIPAPAPGDTTSTGPSTTTTDTATNDPRPEDLEWAAAMFAEWEQRFADLRRPLPALCAETTPPHE